MSVIEDALNRLRRGASFAKALSPGAGSVSLPTRGAALAVDHSPRMSIDLEQLRAAGYLPEEGEERRFADYYRAIKRPLIQKALAADAKAELRLILVSSALPGEGKTFTSLNLAFSMAREHDILVLLVDGDIPRSQISRTLGVHNTPGLSDALREEGQDVESLVLRTNIPSLQVLPAGSSAEGATELIASTRMARLAAQLIQHNPRRLILIDSPPLLVSSEARALVQIPGQIILVARSGQTPRPALLEAIALVEKKKLGGLVLNDAAAATARDSHYGFDTYGSGDPGV